MLIPKSLLDASVKLLLDPGMIKFGVELIRQRYGTEWTILDGQNQVGSVRARFTITAPPGVFPHWVLLTLQHDDGRRMVAHLAYGETALVRLPDGHFQMLAMFLTQKRNPRQKPTLLAVANAYRGLFIGKQRAVNLIGRVPNAADIATLRSAGPDHQLPFRLPQTSPTPLLGAAARLQLPSTPSRRTPEGLLADMLAGKFIDASQAPGKNTTPTASRTRATPRLNRLLTDPALTARLLPDTPAGKSAGTSQIRGKGVTSTPSRARPTPTLNRLLADPAPAARLLPNNPAGKPTGTAPTPAKKKRKQPPRT